MAEAKTIVITGASSGIGAALTQGLAADGHRLYVCARREQRLAEVTRQGTLATHRVVDVGNEADILAFAGFLRETVGHVDALICCAGAYGPIGPFYETDSGAWLAAIRDNLFGTYLAAKHLVPLMVGRIRPRIVTFSGGGAFSPLPRYTAYAASKAAIVRLTETMAEELRPLGIAVNGIAPGFVKTEIHDATLAAGPAAAGTEFYAMTTAKLGEGSVPIDLPVNCVRYLLSDAADGLSGKTLSASFDPWGAPAFQDNLQEIAASDLYTLRRINLINLPDQGLADRLQREPQPETKTTGGDER